MTKKLVIFIIFIVLVSCLVIVINNKKQKNINKNSNIENIEKNNDSVQNTEQSKPNALDYMAPGASKAQEKVKMLQLMKEKNTQEQNRAIEEIK